MVHPAFLRDEQVFKDYLEAGKAGELIFEAYKEVRSPLSAREVRD